jgi:DNA-directed RNA polymerase subunit F
MQLFYDRKEEERMLKIIKKSTDILLILREFQNSEEMAILKSKLNHTCSHGESNHNCQSHFFTKFQKIDPEKLSETEQALHMVISSDNNLRSLLPNLLDFLCSRLHNILRKSQQSKENLPKEELRFLMTEILKRGTVGFFQGHLRSNLHKREQLYSQSQQLLAEPNISYCFFWSQHLKPEAFSKFVKEDFHVFENIVDVLPVSHELKFLEKLGRFDVDSAEQKHLDILPEEVSQSDFPNLARLAREIIKLPNFLNHQLSQLVFIVNQYFRVHWFREEAFRKTINGTCLGGLVSSREVAVFMFIPYSQNSDAEIELKINSTNVVLKAGNGLICKPKKIEISCLNAKLKGDDKGFLLSMDLCGHPEVSKLLGF